MTGVLLKRKTPGGDRDTQGRGWPHDYGGRGWRVAKECQGWTATSRSQEEVRKDSTQTQREYSSADILVSDF